jgi:hypothetical protein
MTARFTYPPGPYPEQLRSRDAKTVEAAVSVVGATVVFAAVVTTAGGAAAEVVAAPGVQAGDVVVATLAAEGNTPRLIETAVAGANQVTVTFDGDPAADHEVNLLVIRPV